MSLKSGTMANWDRDFGGSSEEDFSGITSTSSTSSRFALNNLSYQPGGQGSITASHSSDSQRPQSATHTSSTSTESTGSEGISHTPCYGSVWSHPPHGSASQAHADDTASASGLNDPILEHFALCSPPASASALSIGQIEQTSSLSASAGWTGSTSSGETNPRGTEVSPELGRGQQTPATSEASQDAGNLLGLDPDDNEQTAGTRDRGPSVDWNYQEYWNVPFIGDANHENDAASLREALNDILNENINLQARADATPWVLGADDGRRPISDEFALAPPPGLAYSAYHMQQRSCTWRYQEIQRYRRELTFGIFQQPEIYPALGCGTYPLETLVSIFHPSFLVFHLSRSSVSSLSDQLYAPADLLHNDEYRVGVNLGIGPPIDLDVCPFTPRDRNALRSYQKQKGKDKLKVQESLPITSNLLSIELLADEIDAWLDGIIDSGHGLPEYMELILRREDHDYYSQSLGDLCSWYMESKNSLPEAANQILRPAFKLLITTTLLSLVPKVTHLPDDLLDHLSSQAPSPAGTPLSTTAPRLLTRQIKASIYYLQQEFLRALFEHFTYAMELPLDVKLALAVLVAYVLDLVKNAGRSFAKYAGKLDPSLVVHDQDVLEYETNVQARLFDQVGASIRDAVGKMGGLVERLRSTRSILKGKEKQNDDYRFVSVILGTAL